GSPRKISTAARQVLRRQLSLPDSGPLPRDPVRRPHTSARVPVRVSAWELRVDEVPAPVCPPRSLAEVLQTNSASALPAPALPPLLGSAGDAVAEVPRVSSTSC